MIALVHVLWGKFAIFGNFRFPRRLGRLLALCLLLSQGFNPRRAHSHRSELSEHAIGTPRRAGVKASGHVRHREDHRGVVRRVLASCGITDALQRVCSDEPHFLREVEVSVWGARKRESNDVWGWGCLPLSCLGADWDGQPLHKIFLHQSPLSNVALVFLHASSWLESMSRSIELGRAVLGSPALKHELWLTTLITISPKQDAAYLQQLKADQCLEMLASGGLWVGRGHVMHVDLKITIRKEALSPHQLQDLAEAILQAPVGAATALTALPCLPTADMEPADVEADPTTQ